MMRIGRPPAVAICALAIGFALPAMADAPAPDVTVLCDSALLHAVSDIATLWRKQTGIPVHVISSPTPLLLKQITHPIRSDLAIAQGDVAEATSAEPAAIKPETLFGGWRNRLVVASRAAAPADATDQAGLARRIAAGSIAIVDAPVATAGVDTRKALEAAGLWDAAQARAIGVVGTQDAAYLLTHGIVGLAVVLTTDVAGDKALAVAQELPDGSYAPITYWIAQTKVAQSPNADRFEAFLRQPEAQQRLRADGLEVLP